MVRALLLPAVVLTTLLLPLTRAKLLLLTNAVLQLLDGYVTLLGLGRGFPEGNPLVRSMIASLGPTGGILIAKVAALGFLLVGAGMHTVQTAGLALATDLAPEDKRPRVVAALYAMLLVGMLVAAILIGGWLANFSALRLIQAIQGATQEAVQAIQSIARTIEQVNEVASTIAAAVEEQGAATKEISRNVQQAAAGTQEVSKNIVAVTQASGEVGSAAAQMNGAASELARQAETLAAEVDKFIHKVRAA